MNAIIATKKIALVLALMLIVSGCSIFTPTNNEVDIADVIGVEETGNTVDITSLNNQSVNVQVGDVIYLKLTGTANSGKQWTVVSPTGGEYLILKDHKVEGLNDEDAPNGEFTDEWWMLVAKTGEFTIGFDYGISGQEAERSFSVKVVSQ